MMRMNYDKFLNDLFANFSQNHPCLMKICQKGTLLWRILGPEIHPSGRHIPVPSTYYVSQPESGLTLYETFKCDEPNDTKR